MIHNMRYMIEETVVAMLPVKKNEHFLYFILTSRDILPPTSDNVSRLQQ